MNIDDPKLTAYALGELTGEERQVVEIFLKTNPEAQAFVDETAAFASVLTKEFHAETAPSELAAEQRSELMEMAGAKAKGKIVRFPSRRIAWTAGIGALAAALAIAATGPWGMGIIRQRQLAEPPDFTSGDGDSKFVASTSAKPLPAAAPVEQPAMVSAPTYPASNVNITAGTLTVAAAPRIEPAKLIASTTTITSAGTTTANEATNSNSLPAMSCAKADSLAFQGGAQTLAPAQARRIREFTKDWSKPARGYGGMGSSMKESMDSPTLGERDAYGLQPAAPNAESYTAFNENPFQEVAQNPLSTFSIDVDTASYSNVRRFIRSGQRPPAAAVRIEELINYFHYDYPQPKGDAPFSVNMETARCPWEPEHRLVRIGLKGREIAEDKRPASNLIFLLDVSGSMSDENKLPLVKASMRELVEKLGENDKVAIVVYAGSTGVALPSTRGDKKEQILRAIEELKAEGSTNGAGGIQLAYKTARENLIPGGTNRVILATDGDFNVGTTSESELVKLIEEERKSGVFLTVLGVGEGNLKDSMMKKLASHGNGNYAYIDSLREGRKVLVKQIGGTLVTIAKDVKIQVEFNPRKVASYRLIGYESRVLAKEDFNNDKKDAGEIGAGHTVTALYEVVPVGVTVPGSVDALRYQPEKSPTPAPAVEGPATKEMLTLKLRYKKPTEEKSLLLEQAVDDRDAAIEQSSEDFRFATAVAEFGMLLRGSAQSGSANWNQVYQLAAGAEGRDEGGYRAEFLELVEKAKGRE